MSAVRLSISKSFCTALLLLNLMSLSITLGWAEESGVNATAFADGVRLYREGQYAKALNIFERLHQDNSTDVNTTYYLAITSAQLGRFKQAKGFYEQIVLLDPNGKAAQLAKDGMKYLPDTHEALDLPPKFQAQIQANSPATGTPPQSANQPGAPQQAQASNSGMSPQDLQAIQMMMMMGGGNGGMGGMNQNNPMGGMMPGMMGGQGMQGMDPNIMSTMMMNQMMQNFDLSGGKSDNQ